MAYLISDCVNEARGILNDRDNSSGSYRITDADMVDYANAGLGVIAVQRPDLFSNIGTIPLVAGYIQSAPAGSLRFMEVFGVIGGRVSKECEQRDLDTYNINWPNDAAGPTQNWVRHPRNPNMFFVYPPPDAATIAVGLHGEWSASPGILTMTSPLPIPDAYKPILVEWMVFRAESRDDEYVSQPRAILFMEAFKSNLGVSEKAKATADNDAAPTTSARSAPIQTQAVQPAAPF